MPGATAFVPALIDSGFPCDRFCFEGFLPPKKGRSKRLQQLATEERTMIFYESPYRLVKTLEQFAELFGGDRPASVRGSLAELTRRFSEREPKGEIVLIVAGKPRRERTDDRSNHETE